MLTEERFARILSILEEQKSVTIQELMIRLETSESTVRRDLNAMHEKGLLTKVYGGAVANQSYFQTYDAKVSDRQKENMDEKQVIAKAAASLIQPEDFVYLDAGTTTGMMIDYLTDTRTVFVTNAIGHAKRLSELGFRVYILGGEFKSSTEAIVGEEAMLSLDKYNFTLGFFGTNGISVKNGCTTPEVKEASVKKRAISHCKRAYVLADKSKFRHVSSIMFAKFQEVNIITEEGAFENSKKFKNVWEVTK